MNVGRTLEDVPPRSYDGESKLGRASGMTETKRVASRLRPVWEGAIEGWTVNFIRRSLWRVLPDHQFEDLMQDGYVAFLRVQELYPEIVEAPHFMAMYRTVFTNHVHRLAEKRTKCKEISGADHLDSEGEATDLIAQEKSREDFVAETDVRLLLEDAPAVVRRAILKLLSPEPPVYLRQRGIRETTPQYFQRIAEAPGEDVHGQLVNWITGVRQPK